MALKGGLRDAMMLVGVAVRSNLAGMDTSILHRVLTGVRVLTDDRCQPRG